MLQMPYQSRRIYRNVDFLLKTSPLPVMCLHNLGMSQCELRRTFLPGILEASREIEEHVNRFTLHWNDSSGLYVPAVSKHKTCIPAIPPPKKFDVNLNEASRLPEFVA